MTDLPDSNVWLALTVDRHEHHPVAVTWFDGIRERNAVRFCRMTQLSFLRLCTSKVFLLPSSSPKRWMDASLAAFARLAGMRLVTLDRGFRQYRKAGVQVLELGSAATP
jgi:predicted nucleic acid-binding protein